MLQGRNKADKELEAIATAEVRPLDGWQLDVISGKAWSWSRLCTHPGRSRSLVRPSRSLYPDFTTPQPPVQQREASHSCSLRLRGSAKNQLQRAAQPLFFRSVWGFPIQSRCSRAEDGSLIKELPHSMSKLEGKEVEQLAGPKGAVARGLYW